MANRIAGVALVVLGLWCARFAYQGLKDGKMTLSAIASFRRDRSPILFWLSTCIVIAWAVLGVVGGLSGMINPPL